MPPMLGLQLICPSVSMLCVSSSVAQPMRAAASAASVPAWPPPTTMTSNTAHGHTTEATDLVLLSPAGFARWTAFEPFRRFVFGIFADRLADLMALAEAVAFQRLDQRLAHTLLGHGAVVHATHQMLADELGTVREIVTRLLSASSARAGCACRVSASASSMPPRCVRWPGRCV
jgi:hypothetical protein